jgi:hypothetical protein
MEKKPLDIFQFNRENIKSPDLRHTDTEEYV